MLKGDYWHIVIVENYSADDDMWQHLTRWSHGIEVNFRASDENDNDLLVKAYFPFDPKVQTINFGKFCIWKTQVSL